MCRPQKLVLSLFPFSLFFYTASANVKQLFPSLVLFIFLSWWSLLELLRVSISCVLCCDSISEMRNGHGSGNSSCLVACLIMVISHLKHQLTHLLPTPVWAASAVFYILKVLLSPLYAEVRRWLLQQFGGVSAILSQLFCLFRVLAE